MKWTVSGNNGSAITGYVVTAYLGATVAKTVTFSSIATTETINGLTTGKSYTFKVAARNARGTGPQSTASNGVTVT